jgi:hypothetical protein
VPIVVLRRCPVTQAKPRQENFYDCDGKMVIYEHPGPNEPEVDSVLDLKWSFPEGYLTVAEMIERRNPGLRQRLRE